FGFRFQRVDIPQGATITKAELRVKASNSGSTLSRRNVMALRAALDSSTTPQPPWEGLFNRTLSDWAESSPFASWSTGALVSIDLTSQVQAHVAQPGWCGGDIMA